jgi:hypothetical protein
VKGYESILHTNENPTIGVVAVFKLGNFKWNTKSGDKEIIIWSRGSDNESRRYNSYKNIWTHLFNIGKILTEQGKMDCNTV